MTLYIIITLILLIFFVTFIYTLQGIKRLPKEKFSKFDGIVNIEDAIDYLKDCSKKEWDLVQEAQRIVSNKMCYSRRNSWDTFKIAFKRGMGYCQQQALALKYILSKFGIHSTMIMAVKCKFPPKMVHEYQEPEREGGHTWLQVTINNEKKYVCTCDDTNIPGIIHFKILSKVIENKWYLRPINHFFSMYVNTYKDNRALKNKNQS